MAGWVSVQPYILHAAIHSSVQHGLVQVLHYNFSHLLALTLTAHAASMIILPVSLHSSARTHHDTSCMHAAFVGAASKSASGFYTPRHTYILSCMPLLGTATETALLTTLGRGMKVRS